MSHTLRAAVAASALLAARPPAGVMAHGGVAQEAFARASSDSLLTIFDDVQMQVEDGIVTLSGKVTMPHKKTELARRVQTIPGVAAVRNQIEVLPASVSDDDLRYRVARAIYGNPTFWDDAARPDPPIHIIVDRGHVTLTGVVATEVDRTLARALARAAGARSVTSELRTP